MKPTLAFVALALMLISTISPAFAHCHNWGGGWGGGGCYRHWNNNWGGCHHYWGGRGYGGWGGYGAWGGYPAYGYGNYPAYGYGAYGNGYGLNSFIGF